MHTPTGCVLSRTLKKLDEFERLGLFSPSVIAEKRLEYFKDHRLTCNRCTKRSPLRRWEFVRTFTRHFDEHGVVTAFQANPTLGCRIVCPHCMHAHTVQYLPEWKYIVSAVDTYKISPTLLFSNYALQPVAPYNVR